MATKTKQKPSAKKASAKKASAKKTAKKAPEKQKNLPAKAAALLEEGAFVQFTGYRGEVSEDEIAFQEGDTLYIVEVDDSSDDGILYSCIKAEDVAEFLENGDENIEGGQVAPSEVRELKGGALEKVKETYLPVPSVGRMDEILDEAGGDPIVAAQQLHDAIQLDYFYLGGALAHVLQSGAHLKENGGQFEGEDAFSDFCQAEFGFKGSKGRKLARLYTNFSRIPGFDPEKLSGIGWTIAERIEKYVTPENIDEVLEIAASDEVTQRNVDAVMRERFVTENTTPSGRQATRGEKIRRVSMTFRLDEDSAEAVELALKYAQKQYGLETPELALERICAEWAQEFVETKRAKQSIGAKARKAAKRREAASKEQKKAA